MVFFEHVYSLFARCVVRLSENSDEGHGNAPKMFKGRETLDDKSLRQFASCGTVNFVKIIVAAAEFCRCDQLHEFKAV